MKFAKRIMILILVCLLILSIVPPARVQAATTGFGDVSSSHSNYKAITFLKNNGIMVGLTTTTYGASKNIRREDFITVLYRVAGEPLVSGTCNFSDVSGSAYYYRAVLWAQQNGITQGVGNGKFGVGSNLKYEEFLTFLYRFAKHIGVSTTLGTFPSSYKNYDPYAKDPTAWASRNKLLDKVSSEVTNGNNFCTRADTAQIIYNFYKAFRKTYGLVITDEHFDASYHDPEGLKYKTYGIAGLGFTNGSGPAVVKMLQNACGTSPENIAKYGFNGIHDVDTKEQFEDAFEDAFKDAKCIDVCYAYFFIHGAPHATGVMNFIKNGSWGEPSGSVFGEDLYELANNCKGKVIILMEGCHHGAFVEYFEKEAEKKRVAGTLSVNHPDIYATSAKNTNAIFTSITNTEWKNKVAYGGGTYFMTKALGTYTIGKLKADNKASIPISLYLDESLYESSAGTFNYTITCNGNKDGFVSFAELDWAIKITVRNISYKCSYPHKTTTTDYFSTLPDYCAFGKLS